MPETIVSGSVTGPVNVSAGDIWRFTSGSVVTATGVDGITTFEDGVSTGLTAALDLTVFGTVTSDIAAVYISSEPDPAIKQTATVLFGTGSVLTGDFCTVFERLTGADITNAGQINGVESGMFFVETDGVALNTGSISALGTGVSIAQCDGLNFTNRGSITSDILGIGASDSDNLDLSNSGTISGDVTGAGFSNVANLSLTNFDTITSVSGTGVLVQGSTNSVSIVNSGNIGAADAGLDVSADAGLVVNNGAITGGYAGVHLVFSVADGIVSVRNTGTITATDAVLAEETIISLNNSGLVTGNVRALQTGALGGSMDDTVSNSGMIDGNILLDMGNDTYVGNSGGTVTGFVNGGVGNDMLIGDSGADMFRGGGGADELYGAAGADILEGRAGIDLVVGGGGQDRVIGGTGNDTLTGSGGADTFVFANGDGIDTVTDFAQGSDRFEISGHTGGFGTLVIADQGADLSVSYDGGVIVLGGQAGLGLTAGDFDFV